MPVKKCRVCGGSFFGAPLLRFENMPKAAQFLPDAGSLEQESGVDLEVHQCSACGLVQLNSDPVPYYREVIRSAGVSNEMQGFRLEQFAGFIRNFSLEGKKIVEIGCGNGEYLSIMKRLGVEAYGLEYSEESARLCAAKGLRVSRGFVRTDCEKLACAPFDAFFVLNFLEHIPDPNSWLGGIAANLAQEAAGLVEVPNFDMILENGIFSEFIGDHLFYFTRDTLTATLERNGFEVVDCREQWHDYIISATVKKRKPLDITRFRDSQARLNTELSQFIDSSGPGGVAIWGAGHQAFAVMSLANLAGKIKYVVDSAPFKQGKYTPATHIPIVSPAQLRSNPVEAVIVMAASYSDEVAGIIRNRFGGTIRVAILRHNALQLL